MTFQISGKSSQLNGKVICLGVSGAIAAYKAAALTSLLSQSGAEIHVIMTDSATRFVGELTFETLSHNPVITELWSRSEKFDPQHVDLAKRLDCAVVAPATANIIAKMACGLADDALSTALLTFSSSPVFVAPAMNSRMWNNAATKQNVVTLKSRNIHFIGPNSGNLACRDEDGIGRMAEPSEILAALEDYFKTEE